MPGTQEDVLTLIKSWLDAILFTPPLIPAGIRRNPGIPLESIRIQKKNYTTQNRSIIYKRNYHKRNYRVTILGKIQQMMLTMMNNASFVVWVPCCFQ